LVKTDPEHLQGAIFVDGFFADSFRSEVNNFLDAFYTAYGREPGAMEALVYDSAAMAVGLLLKSGSGSREAFREGLLQVKGYPGVTGKTTFPPSGDAQKELFILTVRDGQIIQVR
jgi:ABC-type branched-subunit amino acid transport system substrate-binding protein